MDSGIYYSRSLGERNHQRIYVWALDGFGPDDGFGHIGITDQAGYLRLQQEVPADLAREIAAARDAGCHSFVISSEHCHSRLVRPEQVQRLRGMLAPLFDRIQVLCAVRPQIDMGLSLLSTAARGWSPITPAALDQIRPHNLYFNFEVLNGRWSAAFGSDNVTFIAYTRGKSVIDHVVSRFGLDPDGFVSPPRTNSAFDARTFAIVNTLAHLSADQQKAMRPVLNPILDDLPVETPLRPSRAHAQDIQAHFTEQNARLIDRRTDLEPGDLDPDWSRYPETGNLDILDATAVHDGQTALLLHDMARQMTLQNLYRALSDTERLILGGRNTQAKRQFQGIERLSKRLQTFGWTRPVKMNERIARMSKTLDN